MPAYLARLQADHQIVGIYSVEHDGELFWLIDECCDPNAVEIAELGSGGVYWASSIDWKVPLPTDGNDDLIYSGLPSDACFTGGWGQTFFATSAELTWKPVPSSSELDD
jgi:hypothetical protein